MPLWSVDVDGIGADGKNLVKTGPCGHTICSGGGCTKMKTGSGDADNDSTKCPANNCNTFIRDFMEDRDEANRIDAVASLKSLFCPKVPVEKENTKPSVVNKPNSWEFMQETFSQPKSKALKTPKSAIRKRKQQKNWLKTSSSDDSEYSPVITLKEKPIRSKNNVRKSLEPMHNASLDQVEKRSNAIESCDSNENEEAPNCEDVEFDRAGIKGLHEKSSTKNAKVLEENFNTKTSKTSDKTKKKCRVVNDAKTEKTNQHMPPNRIAAGNKTNMYDDSKKYININKKNKRGETLLHCACIKVR